MRIETISSTQADRLCALPDLTDLESVHAVNLTLSRVIDGFTRNNSYPDPTVFRTTRIMRVYDNFDRLLFPLDAAARSPAHTLYLSDDIVLRSHTSSMVPLAVDTLPFNPGGDMLLCCPGICFRKNRNGKLHSSEPHQVDIWRFSCSNLQPTTAGLYQFVSDILGSIFADIDVPFIFTEIAHDTSVSHPYLSQIFKIRLSFLGRMVSIGEAGIVNDSFLRSVGLDHTDYSAIAVGVMLDRAVMMIKNVCDIRLLRSKDPKVAEQMRDLKPFTPVSKFPAATRDLSIVTDLVESHEHIYATVCAILSDDAPLLEHLEVISETLYAKLPQHVAKRLGMSPHEKSMLIRLVFRSHEHTLRGDEIDSLMKRLRQALGV